MSSDLSAEITAVATAALAVFAIVTAILAFLAFRKQALEVGLLLEENERDVTERRKAQAALVYLVTSGDIMRPFRLDAVNASDLLAYDVQVW
jgi:hypothetical protein